MESPANPLKIVYPNANRFCRLCLSEPATLIPIQALIGNVAIPKMFVMLTGVEIDFDDPYPQKICLDCCNKLESAYTVRELFLENAFKLQSFFGSVQKNDEPEMLLPQEEIFIKNEPFEDADEEEMEMSGGEDEYLPESQSEEYSDVSTKAPAKTTTQLKQTRGKSFTKSEIVGEPSEMDPDKCYICDKKFENLRDLNAHLPVHSDMLPYTCVPCTTRGGFQKKKIITVVYLHQHIRAHAGTLECPHCPMRAFTFIKLARHFQSYHTKDACAEYRCEKCGFELHTRNSYQAHMNRHEAVEKGLYTCQICDSKFGNSSRLRRHLLTHDNKKQYQCQFCDKSIVSKTLLLAHERRHADKNEYVCPHCDERFKKYSNQVYHISMVHPEIRRRSQTKLVRPSSHKSDERHKYMCNFKGCSYVTNSYQSYFYHKGQHELKFVCTTCSRRFGSRYLLKIHEGTHAAEKPFACHHCNKKYAFKFSLRKHLALHASVRRYLCSVCGESFLTATRLANHVLSHSAPQHKCQYCGRDFRYKGDLVRHVRQHEEEKAAEAENSAVA